MELAERRAAEQADREDRNSQRRVAGLEAALQRAESNAQAALAWADRVARELIDERQARKRAEDELVALRRRAHSLEGERDSARRRAAEADRLNVLVEDLQTELAVSRGAQESLGRQQAAETPHASEPETPPASEPEASPRIAAAAAAVAAGADAASRLGEALAAAARALSAEAMPAPAEPDPSPPAPTSPRRTREHRRRPTRRPLALPPAIFDDSTEAAEYLVRVAGVTVLVDGYNATLAAWSGLPIVEQRARLIDASAELAARTGAEVHVVFDGAEQPDAVPPPAGRKSVRWSFSPPDVEADDVLLELVAGADPGRPVVVASSDGRVRDGVRALGANAISARQFLAVLRRDRR